MEWIKLYTNGILRGSLAQSKDVVQITWIKLMAMANETRVRNGRLEYKRGQPYSRDYIAATCNISKEMLDCCICEYLEDVSPENGNKRVTVEEDGTIVLNNWFFYQDSLPDKKRKQEHAKQLTEDQRTFQLANKNPEIAHKALQSRWGQDYHGKDGFDDDNKMQHGQVH